jgi:glycine/D-amino acid oxidase-like deaminating enzyme
MTSKGEIVVIGAGIAGVSLAYHLAVRHGVRDVVIVDPRPPLSLTSDKSTECYRNWWPNAPMVGLMNRSIDILDELAGETDFGLNRNGYLFVTARTETFEDMAAQTSHVAGLGADAEVLTAETMRDTYPFLTETAVGGLRVPRAGWFRARDLGQWMLEQARQSGARIVMDSVTEIHHGWVSLSDGTRIPASSIVIAAGPMAANVAGLAGLDLPLFSELHLKVAFRDHLGIVPRDAPMTIWSDTQTIDWTDEEREELDSMGRSDVLGEMPVFCHFRPEGGPESPYVVALWEYHDRVLEPTWPLPDDSLYPEVVMRGLTTMVPGLGAYRDRLPESSVDGGYYTKTAENRPLIGPTEHDGVYLMAGLSGFGVMVAAGAADLLARHLLGKGLPGYSSAFLLSRFDDPQYLADVGSAGDGQL